MRVCLRVSWYLCVCVVAGWGKNIFHLLSFFSCSNFFWLIAFSYFHASFISCYLFHPFFSLSRSTPSQYSPILSSSNCWQQLYFIILIHLHKKIATITLTTPLTTTLIMTPVLNKKQPPITPFSHHHPTFPRLHTPRVFSTVCKMAHFKEKFTRLIPDSGYAVAFSLCVWLSIWPENPFGLCWIVVWILNIFRTALFTCPFNSVALVVDSVAASYHHVHAHERAGHFFVSENTHVKRYQQEEEKWKTFLQR
jgi:hypothetical protein